MLNNFSHMVDVARAECAVEADKVRELAAIPDKPALNQAVANALSAGAIAVGQGVVEVDAFACGEPGALRALPVERLGAAAKAAASAGQVGALAEVLARGNSLDLDQAGIGAAENGHVDAMLLLRDCGCDLGARRVRVGSPLV